MKTFFEYLEEQNISDQDMAIIVEGLESEWSDELEEKVDMAIDEFVSEYKLEDGSYDLDRFNSEITNEGLLGSILGGLTGFALGKSVGKIIARVLGIDKGIFYDLLTSRLVGAALGAAIGKSF